MRITHWFDFETYVTSKGDNIPVKVEATISSDRQGDVEIEGFKVKLIDSNVEIAPSDAQINQIRSEIYERVNEVGSDIIPHRKDDWRNEW